MNTVIVILGPTGVGKTGLSLMLAEKLKTEIISADSMLVYRHMNIGTAKPSEKEREAVPHHLIDILNPDEKFSAGLFREKATAIIEKLHARQKIPIVAGGTGLYIRSLTGGLFEGPGGDDALRERLKEEGKKHGRGYLYEKLKSADPEAASKIKPNDMRRTIRALEIILKTGKEISHCQGLTTRPCSYDFIKIGLTREREELYGMIEERVDSMIEKGLLEETRQLLAMNPSGTALQALGYKEMALYLKGKVALDEAVWIIKKRTKNFAKRQFTWFRKEQGVHWVNISGAVSSSDIYSRVINSVEILKNILYSMEN